MCEHVNPQPEPRQVPSPGAGASSESRGSEWDHSRRQQAALGLCVTWDTSSPAGTGPHPPHPPTALPGLQLADGRQMVARSEPGPYKAREHTWVPHTFRFSAEPG